MAHFAELDDSNVVVRVIVVHNDVITIDGVEVEQEGIDFLNGLYPDSGTWVATSYNANNRHKYAGVGDTYDLDRDVFLPSVEPTPYPSWTLNEYNDWEPPVVRVDGYDWDEGTLAWVKPDSPFLSWVWNVNVWTAPTPHPDGSKEYFWDESALEWVDEVPEFLLPDADDPYPGDGNSPPFYRWNTATREWVEVPE